MNYFVVFDFETDGKDPETCNPVQLAAIVIDPHNLEIIESSAFCSDMKPKGITGKNYLTDERMKTIQFHMKNQGKTQEEILERWKSAPNTKSVWQNFVQHVEKYNTKKSQWTAPVAAGMNIRNFDLPIVDRLNKEYKINRLFNYEVVDLRELFYYSLVWDTSLRSRAMDVMVPYFGLNNDGAHDALVDVKNSALLIQRYLRFFKNQFNRKPNPYKNCFKQ